MKREFQPRVVESVLIGIAALLLYLSTLTWDYYWDGITFAFQIESVADRNRGLELLIHQNHLLYNAIGYLLYRTAKSAGLAVRALTLLQVANAIFGALSVAVFYRLASRTTRAWYAAIVCTAALAVSAAWWKIAPNMREVSNARVAAARKANAQWNERTVVYYVDLEETDTTFQYFNMAAQWRRLRHSYVPRLETDISQTKSQGGETWVNRTAIERVGNDWLAKHHGGDEISVEKPNAFARYVRVVPGH